MSLVKRWLPLMALFTVCIRASMILDELPPVQHIHGLRQRIETASLDLQRSETFLWGSDDVDILAHLTVYRSKENERFLSLERCIHHFDISCADDLHVTFHDGEHYMYARYRWNWVNEAPENNIVIVMGGGHCTLESSRAVFNMFRADYDDDQRTIAFKGSRSVWKKVARIWDLHITSFRPEYAAPKKRSFLGGLEHAWDDVESAASGPVTSAIVNIESSVTQGVVSVATGVASTAVEVASVVTPAVASAIGTAKAIVTSEYSVITSAGFAEVSAITSEAEAITSVALALFNGGVSFPFDVSVPSYNFTSQDGGLNVALDCSRCNVSGGFQVEIHAHGNWSNVLDLTLGPKVNVNVTLRPQNFSIIMEPALSILCNSTTTESGEEQLLNAPLWEAGGFEIPNILSLGPRGVVSLGYRTKNLTGSANISVGTTVTIPNNAIADLVLEIPSPHVKAAGWHETQISYVPFTIDAQLHGELEIFASIDIQLQAEGMNAGFDAFLSLQPYIGANMSLVNCTDSPPGHSERSCFAENKDHQYRITVVPSMGGDFLAGAAKVQDQANPLISTKIASASKVFPTKTFAFGPGMH